MALATMASRVFGLVREQVIAYYYGAGVLVDAFNVAYRIPNLLRDLLAEGAFSSSFLSEFAKAKVDGKEAMKQLFLQCFWILFFIAGIYAVILTTFASKLILLFAPEYLPGSEQAIITTELLKIMSPFLLFMSLGAVAMAVLNTHRIFFLPAVSPVFFNLSSILVILIAAHFFQNPTISMLAWGVLLGGFLQFLVQVPRLYKEGYRFTFPTKFWGPEVKKVFTKLIPGLFGFAAAQINILINTILATSSGVGAVSWLSYAFRIFQLPLGIIGVSLGTGNQVYFAEKWKSAQFAEAADILSRSLFYSLSLMMFPFLLLAFFPAWPMELLFERGKFSHFDTQMSAMALMGYSFGLPFYGVHKILVPVFYTIDKQKIVLAIAVISILINIALASLLVSKYGFSILAWASTISISINAILLFCFLPSQLFQKRNFFVRKRVLAFAGLSLSLCGYFMGLKWILSLITVNKLWLAMPFLVVPVLLIELFLSLADEKTFFLFRRKKMNEKKSL